MIKLFGDDPLDVRPRVDDQAAIEEHNRRVALKDAAADLDGTADLLGRVQGDVSEVPLHMEAVADELQPMIDKLRALATKLRTQINRPEG